MASVRGSGYDLRWVAEEEVRAKQLLLDMMDLLSSDPYMAMGLIPSATPADIRRAFLARTKQFHPARFARMAPDIQRLANEVFLALRAVHETMAKPQVKAPPRPSPLAPATRPGGAVGSTGMRPVTGAAVAPAAIPPTPAPAGARPQGFPQATIGTRPGTQAVPARPSPMPAPTTGVRSTVGSRAAGPPGGAARPQAGAGATPATAAPAGVDRELAPVYELFAQQQLAAAKLAVEGLLARSPQSTKYRALLAYAKGRAAQVEKRIDEARVELHEALTLDPDLQLAKTALAELFTRRR